MRTNIFHDTYKIANSSVETSRFPYYIDVELTNNCNLSCNFCSRQFMKRDKGFMTEETFDEILKEIEKTKTPLRFIRWGEPFLHPKVLNFIKKVKRNDIPLHITTNGLLLNDKICDVLILCGVDSIIFSMQGTNKEEYESSRIKGDYQKLTDNIKDLVKMRGKFDKPYITITTTISKGQGKDKKQFIDYWEKIVDKVNIGNTNLSRINGSTGNHVICKMPWQQLSIDWDGSVSACCDDFDRLMNLGNVNKDSLIKLWNSNAMEAYRTLIRYGKHDSLSLCSRCYPAHGDIWK